MPLRSVIVEGVDRLGKNSLITGFKDRLGFFQEIHYQTPELLACLAAEAQLQFSLSDGTLTPDAKKFALKRYQMLSFTEMLKLLSSDARLVLNRSHLGEFVYAPRYRGYDGSYVFDLERTFIERGSKFHDTTLLVLLHTTSFSFISDDGNSLNFERKEEEQNDFVRAFERSQVKHKLMLDVHDGAGNFVPVDVLRQVVTSAFIELPGMQHQTMHVSWSRSSTGQLERQTFLQPDLKRAVF